MKMFVSIVQVVSFILLVIFNIPLVTSYYTPSSRVQTTRLHLFNFFKGNSDKNVASQAVLITKTASDKKLKEKLEEEKKKGGYKLEKISNTQNRDWTKEVSICIYIKTSILQS